MHREELGMFFLKIFFNIEINMFQFLFCVVQNVGRDSRARSSQSIMAFLKVKV